MVGRAGDPALVEPGLALVADRFPGTFSADLIAGLPFQTTAIIKEDIERLLAFGPAHVSLYSLTLEPETILEARTARFGKPALSLPTDDEADELWISGRDLLEDASLSQYEVSNFARAGKESVHNTRYWQMESWIGVGPAASGTLIGETGDGGTTIAGHRFTYPRDVGAYLSAGRPAIHAARNENLSASDLMLETLLMGFRYRGGPDPFLFKARFGCDIADRIPATVARWRERGFFEAGLAEGILAPSKEGLLFVNGFLRDAFDEMKRGIQN